MTLPEVRTLKEKAELEIREIIDNFSKETGLIVSGLDYATMEMHKILRSQKNAGGCLVKLEISI